MNRVAIILIAGMGTRLKPLTLKTHKCLTEINNVSILENALGILETFRFKKVVLVIGYLGEHIRERIEDHFGDMRIEYVENATFSETNTSFSLKLGLEKTEEYDEVFVLEGDVYFESALIKILLDAEEKNATLLEKYNPDLDGTFVELDKSGYVIDWTHKSQRPADYILDGKYKTVNIHKFDKKFVQEVLNPEVYESICRYQGREPLENIMMRVVKRPEKNIKGIVLNGEKWFEIDDINDLKKAEEMFKD